MKRENAGPELCTCRARAQCARSCPTARSRKHSARQAALRKEELHPHILSHCHHKSPTVSSSRLVDAHMVTIPSVQRSAQSVTSSSLLASATFLLQLRPLVLAVVSTSTRALDVKLLQAKACGRMVEIQDDSHWCLTDGEFTRISSSKPDLNIALKAGRLYSTLSFSNLH